MALNITSPLTTINGIQLQTSYGRVAVLNNIGGQHLEAALQIYPSKEAFEANLPPLQFDADFRLAMADAYDYATDSKDILDLGHGMLIGLLASQGVTATKDLA